jgi:site-specific recombinase XerD
MLEITNAHIEAFGKALRRHGRLDATVESYCRDAAQFLAFLQQNRLPIGNVAPETLLQFAEWLQYEKLERRNSIRRSMIGVRQFFRYLSEASAIVGTPFDEVPIPSRDDTLGWRLDDEEVDLIFEAADAGHPAIKRLRDKALLCLLAFEGVKTSELIALTWGDFDDRETSALLRIGGARARLIALHQSTAQALRDYEQLHGDGTMFLAFKGRESNLTLPNMTRHGLKFILYEIGNRIGLQGLNAEKLRHYAIDFQLALGKTPEQLQHHLGLRRPGLVGRHLLADSVADT